MAQRSAEKKSGAEIPSVTGDLENNKEDASAPILVCAVRHISSQTLTFHCVVFSKSLLPFFLILFTH